VTLTPDPEVLVKLGHIATRLVDPSATTLTVEGTPLAQPGDRHARPAYRRRVACIGQPKVALCPRHIPTNLIFTTATKSGTIARVGERCASDGQIRLSPSAWKIGTSGHTAWQTATKFCMVIKLDERKIITGSATSCLGQKFMWHDYWRAISLRYS